MQVFSGADLLLFASKLSVTMANDERLPNTAYQRQIAADLLPNDLYDRYLKLQHLNHNSAAFAKSVRPLITHMHTLHFMKRVILDHSFQGTRTIHNETDPTSAKDAFRLLHAYGDYLGIDPNAPQFTERMFRGLVRNSLLLHREEKERLLGRYYKLLFVLPSEACKDGAIDLPKTFSDAEGIDLKLFFAMGALLITRFTTGSRLKADATNVEQFERSFFVDWEKDFNWLPKETISLIRKTAVMTSTQAKDRFIELENEATKNGVQLSYEYGLRPFVEKPLLELTPSVSALTHYPFLAEKFTVGIYWSIFDYLKDKAGGAYPGSFANYWGCLCQKYAEQIFCNDIIRSRKIKAKCFIDRPYEKGGTEARGSDIILYDPEQKELFLFDVTYSALRMQTAFEEDNIKHLDDGINKLIEKAEQINEVIQDIKSGVLKLDNVSPNKIRKYRPFIITMASYPMWSFIWNTIPNIWTGINDRLKDKGYFTDSNVVDLKIFTVAELEELAARHSAGVSIFQILRGWSSNPRWATEALLNYLLTCYREKIAYAALKEQFKSAVQFSIDILKKSTS